MSAVDRLPEILEMRARRMSLQSIGEEIGVSRERIRQLIGNTGNLAGLWSDVLIREVVEYREQGLNSTEIARKIGKGKESVYYQLKKLNIPRRTTNGILFKTGLRKCAGCQHVMELKNFGPDVTDPSGKNQRCFECNRKCHREFYLCHHPDAHPYSKYGRGLKRLNGSR